MKFLKISNYKVMDVEKWPRSKKFISTDSLWYEEERLNTFIDWPVTFISPEELAANGFYYLRTRDHCACAFCQGIIGVWEEGDSISSEHKKHFPHCPLINGQFTPNVPLIHGNIIAKLNRKNAIPYEDTHRNCTNSFGEDVCGTGREDLFSQRNIVVEEKENSCIPFTHLGVPMYSGPKKKDYLTYDSRLNTFKDWPDKVAVTPQDLADAGFYYIGLSDHVRCFHCGNGLRNWEPNDIPWEEHARWYPECHFILLKKGTDFVNKVKKSNPPYVHAPPNQPSVYYSKGTKYNKFNITDEELSKLMDLQIVKATSDMGFSDIDIKTALKLKLEQAGVPFLNLNQCIEAVLQVSEKEKPSMPEEGLLDQMHESEMHANPSFDREMDVQEESNPTTLNATLQNSVLLPTREQSSLPVLPPRNKLVTNGQEEKAPATSELLPSTSDNLPSTYESLPSTSESLPSASEILPSASEILPSASESLPSASESLPSTSESVRMPSSTNTENRTSQMITESSMRVSELQNLSPEMSDDVSSESSVTSSQILNINKDSAISVQNYNKDDLLAEADEIIKATKVLLGKDSLSSSGHSSLESLDQLEEISNKNSQTTLTADDLTKELEKIKDGRTCRVCMDTEMEVVFLPCTHMTACSSCAVTLSNCPICRGNIQYVIKPIIS